MFKDGIVRFIKAHGIAVLAVIALALVLKFVLHFSFILSFLVLLILYFAIGFAIDIISEKVRLKKAQKSISKNRSAQNEARRNNYQRGTDGEDGGEEKIFEGVNDIDDGIAIQGRGKQRSTLRKLSTDMKSIIAASPEGKESAKESSDSFEPLITFSKKNRSSSSSDYMKGTDYTYSRFADRNNAKAARASEAAAIAAAEAEEIIAGADAADDRIVSAQETVSEVKEEVKETAGEIAGAAEQAAEKAEAEAAVNAEKIEKAEENIVSAAETAAAAVPETPEETVPAIDETLFVSPDIEGDTKFSEDISDAVDKILSESQRSVIRRNKYKTVEKVPEEAPAKTQPEPEEKKVRSHISSDIDTRNTLFGAVDGDGAEDEEIDMVNTDSTMVSTLFSGRKKEQHVKPSLEEYRRRTENTGGSRRSLTKEILEGNGAKTVSDAEKEKAAEAVSETIEAAATAAETAAAATAAAASAAAAAAKEAVKEEKAEKLPEIKRVYEIPPVDLLAGSRSTDNVGIINSEDDPKAQKLINTLESFGVGAKIIGVMRGPAVTRYELQPNPGVKVSRIVALSDDIALNMASTGVRIEAPIPGKEAVGIEVPNSQVEIVSLRHVIESDEFRNSQSPLSVALGRDIAGKNIVADIAKMPHLLIAGATGSGKSVCINTIVASILFKAGPEDVRMIMIDPKIVELGVYNGIPHLLVPVVTNPKKAAGALSWAVSEMENRYTLFSQHNVRDIKAFNVLAQRDKSITKLPQILIIIDELADLMMVAAKEIEDSIIRLSQKARAAGLHIIIATQRPSVDVITGLIKANIPSRIAFAVTSQIDSRTILDGGGAEKLLGRGDMLFHPIGMAKPLRVQGAFVSDSEIEALADNVRNSYGTTLYRDDVQSSIDQKDKPQAGGNAGNSEGGDEDQDADYEMIDAAAQLAIEYKQLSTSFLQRKLRLGYSRASRIVDTLEAEGLISEADGSKPRQLLMTKEEWEAHIANSRGEQA